jgi:hypothetical protein
MVGPERRESLHCRDAGVTLGETPLDHPRAGATADSAQAGVCGEACRTDGRGQASATDRKRNDKCSEDHSD